jgi:hypothetical protein
VPSITSSADVSLEVFGALLLVLRTLLDLRFLGAIERGNKKLREKMKRKEEKRREEKRREEKRREENSEELKNER